MSQLLSHFTAFFIIMVTETSIVESCISLAAEQHRQDSITAPSLKFSKVYKGKSHTSMVNA